MNMLQLRMNSIREEISEVESLPELKAIWCHWNVECPEAVHDAECASIIKVAVRSLKANRPAEVIVEPNEELLALVAELSELRSAAKPKPPVQRASRKYRL